MNRENLGLLDDKITSFRSLSVIKGYYLVLGGGKIGNDFVQYAKKYNLPFVLVIDIDENAPASGDATVLSSKELFGILEQQAKSSRIMDPTLEADDDTILQTGIYFHCMDVKDVPSILKFGIPEYLVPAIPSHALVDMVVDILNPHNGPKLVDTLSINDNDDEMLAFFGGIRSRFPEELVVFSSPEHGAIMLSYARIGEICPDNCMGPAGYCSNFSREKPDTITGYTRSLMPDYMGWVFESCQMKPGIGGIRGTDLKDHLLSVMEHVRCVHAEEKALYKKGFFIATTCNCHGILNILSIV